MMLSEIIALTVLIATLIAIILGLSYLYVSTFKKDCKKIDRFYSTLLILVYFFSWIIFFIGLASNSSDYRVKIDPVDSGYSPLAKNHLLSFLTFQVLSLIGMYKIWKQGRSQAPLLLTAYLTFITTGIVLNTCLAAQLSYRNDGELYIDSSAGHWMMTAPALHVVLSLKLLVKIISTESYKADERNFKNKFLNRLNEKIRSSKMLPLWSLLALLPVFLTMTLILILFGQEFDSLAKAFTETSTWRFSQETHPPYLDHKGHYLCTVAACGTPKIVKSLRLGIRNGEEIIVNRQLLIANAFEDLLMKQYPRIHQWVRRNYDKYGYPLSKDINTHLKSNMIYFAMKPLEWIFLIYIYLNSETPEKLINRQYEMSHQQQLL